MNKLRVSIFFFLIFLSIQSFAQEINGIKKSEKVEMIDGKKFYIHKVRKGQTVYSISKAYGIKIEDIYKYNPDSEQGLQLDQELRVPFINRAISSAEPPQDSLSADGKFIYHRVKRGETLYRIMKKFNVNQEVLLKYNSGLSVNLYPGDIIKIPTQENLVSEEAKKLYADVEEYKVKRKDNYYRLQKKFAVNQQQLEQLNPQLKSTGLQKGMIILMPKGLKKLDTIPIYRDIRIDTAVLEEDLIYADSIFTGFFDCDSLSARQDTFKVALMIPFYSELEPEIRTSNAYYVKSANHYKSFTFIQFYEGFLMAVDSMKQRGFNVEVFVYDTKADTATVRSITQREEFNSFDLIIGPLFHKNLKIVLEKCANNNTKLISPFSRDTTLLANYPNLYKVVPGVEAVVKSSCKWVSDSLPNARIMVIYENNEDQKQVVDLMKEYYRLNAGQGIDTSQLFFYSFNRAGLNKMINNLSKDRKNVLLSITHNEAKMSDFLRQMNPKAKDYDITLLGSELSWKRFETLEKKYLVNLRLTQCTSHFIDPQDTAALEFEKLFINRFQTVPSTTAYIGFDLSWYFFNALYYYGSGFEACLEKLKVHNMSTKYEFERKNDGGYENQYLNMYQYNDYKIVNKKP